MGNDVMSLLGWPDVGTNTMLKEPVNSARSLCWLGICVCGWDGVGREGKAGRYYLMLLLWQKDAFLPVSAVILRLSCWQTI